MDNTPDFDSFTTAYIESALWNCLADDGQPLAKNHGAADLADEAVARIIEDCRRFQEENRTLIEQAEVDTTTYDRFDLAGHDFWLTRNGAGAGFWDGDWLPDELGNKLADAAHAFGECDLYKGDDGKIYLS